jgi:hypothetical protein
MTPVGRPGRRRGGADDADTDAVVALLLFEAADCLMAVPASEVSRLGAVESPAAGSDEACAPEERIDLGQYFGGHESEGPWLQWRRGARRASLRVARVVEVISCAIGALAPMPASMRAGAFWAVGVRDEDVFLLMDPARLASERRRPQDLTPWTR